MNSVLKSRRVLLSLRRYALRDSSGKWRCHSEADFLYLGIESLLGAGSSVMCGGVS